MTIHFTDKKTNTKSFDKSNAVIYTYTLSFHYDIMISVSILNKDVIISTNITWKKNLCRVYLWCR